jgi:para-aminobenzoate synthetase/4-amino-4-deoxychorismate lyase
VEAALRDWAASAPSVAQRVRLLVAREGTVSVQAQAFNAPPEAPVRLRLAPHPIDPDDRFLYHKTTRRRVYEEARAAAPDADDVLLWNPKEELTETTIANLVVELDGERVTPPVSCGLLPGTFRAALLAEGAIREGVVRRSDLPRCRRLWLINSVRQWREAVLLD